MFLNIYPKFYPEQVRPALPPTVNPVTRVTTIRPAVIREKPRPFSPARVPTPKPITPDPEIDNRLSETKHVPHVVVANRPDIADVRNDIAGIDLPSHSLHEDRTMLGAKLNLGMNYTLHELVIIVYIHIPNI